MELLDDVCHMESHFNPLRDSVSFMQEKPLWKHPMVLLGEEAQVKMLGPVCLEIVLILIKDSCMVCMEHTICLKIKLDAPDETPS